MKHLALPANIGACILLTAALAVLGPWGASPALAKLPTGDFSSFSGCPRFTPGVNLCLYVRIVGGQVMLAREVVPIASPIVIQGGIERNSETEAETFLAALGGRTIFGAPQPVPGGLSGLLGCGEIGSTVERNACRGALAGAGVGAIVELARPAGEIAIDRFNLIAEEGTGLSLPVKVHLVNRFLGSECYIGSSSNPLVLELTTGKTAPPSPNKPIHGTIGPIEAKDLFDFVELPGNVFVDNSFSVPAARGCGGPYSYVIDPIIDRRVGLPSPGGRNTAILSGNIEEATTVGVLASEE